MSQYGANGMANAGYNYSQILKHYYSGITITKKWDEFYIISFLIFKLF